MVNRLWGWHFGRGLVASTENFGVLGDRPSHPDLLDWLARRFMESGWSVRKCTGSWCSPAPTKWTRLIPVWHPTARRARIPAKWTRKPSPLAFPDPAVEAEQVRDALLAAGGLLDASLGAKPSLRNREFVFNHTSRDHTNYKQSPPGALSPCDQEQCL
ncbi:MAG: DUF1553 domain-containing protein [Verrucomicrobiales bacterium]